MSTIVELFGTYERYAWRLEARDVYAVGEQEQVTDWLAGRERAPGTSTSEWQQMTIANREQGRPVSRVRLVGHPVTLYTAWEMAAYPDNISAGEEVRILDRAAIADDLNPLWDMDFWLFDDQFAAIMHYDRTGGFHGATITEGVNRFVALRALALDLSVPYDEYQLPAW